MLMDSFEVENFRSLKHLKLEKLARVNLLVGKNNSGKTTVLEALYALIGTGTANWLTVFLRERGMAANEFDFKHLFYALSPANSVNMRADYHRAEQSHLFDTGNHFAKVRMTYISGTTAQDDLEWELGSNLERSVQEGGLAIDIQTETMGEPAKFELVVMGGRAMPRFRLRESTENNVDVYNINNTSEFKILSRPNIAFVPSYSILRNYSADIERLKIAKLDNELVDVLRQVDPRIERIELGSNGNVFFNLGPHFNTLLPASLMGEGIQRLLVIVSVLASRKQGVVLIDEIDNGLHYSALRALWKGIFYAAHKYDVQVISTTHSAEALRHLTWVLDSEDGKAHRDDVAAYTLIRADDDTVRTYRHDYEQLDYALDHGVEIRN